MQQRALEERELSREELQALRNKRTGVTVFQFSWIMVFVCLIYVNLNLRGNFTSWPPPGVAPLDALLPTIATIGLLVSGALANGALRAVRGGNNESFMLQWRITLTLGGLFILIMAYECISVPTSGMYSTIFRVMTVYHALHAIVIGYIMYRVYGNAATYDQVHNWAVEASVKLWYFVVVAWILFYVVLYLI